MNSFQGYQQGYRKLQKSIFQYMVAGAVAFLVAVIHFSNWGGDSLNIVYLKTAQWTGIAGNSQYDKLVSICYQLKKYDCVESALRKQAKNNPDALKELAVLQFKRKKPTHAAVTYKKYFDQVPPNDTNMQAAFTYAKVLEQIGNKEEALQLYDRIISQKQSKTIPVNVIRNKLNLLSSMNRKKEAIAVINKYKKLSQKANDYLKQEISMWEGQI